VSADQVMHQFERRASRLIDGSGKTGGLVLTGDEWRELRAAVAEAEANARAEAQVPAVFLADDPEECERAAREALAEGRREGAAQALRDAARDWQHYLRRDASLYDYGRWLDAAANMLRRRAAALDGGDS
jgi:flagellar biosynthesis/type III secretory pathway protein FliH